MTLEGKVEAHEARLNAINGQIVRAATATEKNTDAIEQLRVEVVADRVLNQLEHKSTRKEIRILAAIAVAVAGLSGYLPGAHQPGGPAKAVSAILRLL